MFEGNTYDWFIYRDKIDTSIASSTPLASQISFTVAKDRLEVIFIDGETGKPDQHLDEG